MIAVRKSILLSLAALSLLAGLSGCIVAERPGHYRGDYVAQGPNWRPHHHWNGNGWQGNQGGWSNGWQGNGQGGDWNN